MNMNNQKGNIVLIIVGIIAVAILAGGVGYFVYQKTTPKGCTEELKICSDGTGVGRTGPNCEFASCPKIIDETAGWKTYRNEKYGFEFRYPTNWYAYPQQDPIGMGISILLLKSEKLPSIEGTEGYALGDLMLVHANSISLWNGGKLSKIESVSKEEYIQQNFLNEELVKEFNVITKQIVINGLDMLRVEKDTAGASGRELQYVYFKNERVYSFSLYPYEPTSSSALAKNYEDFEKLVSTFSFIQ